MSGSSRTEWLALVDLGLPERLVSAFTPSDHPILLGVNDAAGCLGMLRATLYGLIAKGELQVCRLGRSIRVPWHELGPIALGAA